MLPKALTVRVHYIAQKGVGINYRPLFIQISVILSNGHICQSVQEVRNEGINQE